MSGPTASSADGNISFLDVPELSVGVEVVAGFHLVARISRNDVVEVWRATRPDGVLVALKCVNTTRPGAGAVVRALDMMVPVRHAHLLSCFGPWERNGWMAYGMDLADGSLLDRFEAVRRVGCPGLESRDLIELIGQAARGIDFLGEPQPSFNGFMPSPLVLRNIQPGNLFLVGATVRVGISGLVQRFGADQGAGMQPFGKGRAWPLTVYSAPEMHRELVSMQSDQYSLAASYAHLRGVPLPIRNANHFGPFDLTKLPVAERSVVARALTIEPAARWPSCVAFVAALDDAIRLVVSLPLRTGLISPMPLVVDQSSPYRGTAPPVVPGGQGKQALLDDVLRENGPALLDRFATRKVAQSQPVVPKPSQVNIAAPVESAVNFEEAVRPEVVQVVAIPPVIAVNHRTERESAEQNPAPVAPERKSQRRLAVPAAGLVAGVVAVLIWFGLRGSLPRIAARFEQTKPLVVQQATISTPETAVADRSVDDPPQPALETEVVPPGNTLEAVPAVGIRNPPAARVEPPPVAASPVVVTRETISEPPLTERDSGLVAKVDAPLILPAAPPVSQVEAAGPAPLAPPVPVLASHPPESPSAAMEAVATPPTGPTSAELAAALQGLIRATLSRLELQASSILVAGRAWVRALPPPTPPLVGTSAREPVQGPLGPRTATIVVLLPTAKAELVVRGEVGRGNPDEWYGPTRVIHSPPLIEAQDYLVGAFWTEAGGRPGTRSQPLRVEPGRRYEVDLRSDQTKAVEMPTPTDR